MTAVSKVILNGTTLMDATTATATASAIIAPYTAMLADGVMTTGTGSGGGVDQDMVDFIANTPRATFDNNTIERVGVMRQQNPTLQTFVMRALKTVTTGNVFAFNKKLELAVFPAWEGETSYDGFRGCEKLVTVDFGERVTRVAGWSFEACTVFNTLILRNTSLVSLAGQNAFSGTLFEQNKAGGTLYVPSALISSYQSASNWSTILGYANNSIQAIEGSQYETHYADGSLIE